MTFKAKENTIKYLLIDTDVYIQCSILENEGDDKKAIDTLLAILNNNEVKLLLPEVVKLEFNKVLKQKLKSLKNTVGIISSENIRKNNNLDEKVKDDLNVALSNVIEEREINIKEVEKLLEQVFSHENTIQLQLSSEAILRSYKMFLSGEKPYSSNSIKGEIQTDCLIIDSASEYLKEKSNYDLFICSRNKSDFCDKPINKDGKYRIAKSISDKFKSVEYTPNLFQLLNDKFGANFGKPLINKIANEIIDDDPVYYPATNQTTSFPATSSQIAWSSINPTGSPTVSSYTFVEPVATTTSYMPLMTNSTRTIICSNCGKKFRYINHEHMDYLLLSVNQSVHCTYCGHLNLVN